MVKVAPFPGFELRVELLYILLFSIGYVAAAGGVTLLQPVNVSAEKESVF